MSALLRTGNSALRSLIRLPANPTNPREACLLVCARMSMSCGYDGTMCDLNTSGRPVVSRLAHSKAQFGGFRWSVNLQHSFPVSKLASSRPKHAHRRPMALMSTNRTVDRHACHYLLKCAYPYVSRIACYLPLTGLWVVRITIQAQGTLCNITALCWCNGGEAHWVRMSQKSCKWCL